MDNAANTSQTVQTRNPISRLSSFLLALSLVSFAATLFWLAKSKWPLGVAGEWQIKPNNGPWPAPAWGLPIAVLFIFGGLAAISAYDRFKRAKNEKEKRGSTRLCIVGLTILAFAWPWSLLGPIGTSTLIAAQFSDISNEYFGTAYQVENARDFSREYSVKWQTSPSIVQAHVATHPPGAVLGYYFSRRIYEASPFLQSTFSGIATSLTNDSIEKLATESNQIRQTAERSAGVKNPDPALPVSAVGAAIWCAFLISVFLASCVPAIFFVASLGSVGSTLDANDARGMIAASLFALSPILSLFAFSLDALIACGAAWTLAFIALRLRGGKPIWLLASGAMLGVTSFVSFGALAIGAIAVIALLFAKRRNAVREILIFGGGFFLMWCVLTLLFPSNPLEIFRNAMSAHSFATVQSRSRGAWIGMNLVCYAVFCGWPLVWAACAGGFGFLKNLQNPKIALSTPIIIGVAALLTMLLLTLSGGAKGEVERLWLFLTPSLAALAASTLMQRPHGKSIGVLLLLQAGQTLIMAAWLAPLVLPL